MSCCSPVPFPQSPALLCAIPVCVLNYYGRGRAGVPSSVALSIDWRSVAATTTATWSLLIETPQAVQHQGRLWHDGDDCTPGPSFGAPTRVSSAEPAASQQAAAMVIARHLPPQRPHNAARGVFGVCSVT